MKKKILFAFSLLFIFVFLFGLSSCQKEDEGTLEYELNSDGESYIVIGIGTFKGKELVIDTYNGLKVSRIDWNAFLGCSTIESVTIGDGVYRIGRTAFQGCTNLKSVTISGGVSEIDNGAFEGCVKLSSVTIGEGVSVIGEYAFVGCTSLTSITLPSSITTIYGNAFSRCQRLVEVINHSTLSISAGSDEYGHIGYYAKEVHSEKTKLQSIDGYLFYTDKENKSYLLDYTGNETKLTLPESFNGKEYEIYKYAFSYCDKLTGVIIPSKVTGIGESAFNSCESLLSVSVGEGVKSIGKWAFAGCTKLVEIVNNSSFDFAAHPDTGYASADVHSGSSNIIDIDGYLFYTFDGINYLLGYAGKDTELTLPESFNGEGYEIAEYAFYRNNTITFVTVPDCVTSINDLAFYACNALKKVKIGNSTVSIGFRAFNYCTALTDLTLGDNVKTIDDWAFLNCTSLTSVTLGSSIESIGEWAFGGCVKLLEVINKSSLDIKKGEERSYGGIAFYAADVHTGESKIVKQDGYLFYTYGGTDYLIGYEGDDKELSLPKSFNGKNYEIHQYAFGGNTHLTKINIPDKVTKIGKLAFAGCTNLTKINIPDNVTKIDQLTFEDCTSLSSISFGKGVESIGYGAFYECRALTDIIISDSVTSIESNAFYGCRFLKSITIGSGVEKIGKDAFELCRALAEAIFKNPNAWSADKEELLSSEISNPETAADYLTDTYRRCDWLRK